MQETTQISQKNPTWTNLTCIRDLVKRGGTILTHQWNESIKYESIKISEQKWLVKRLPIHQIPYSCKLIPAFINTSSVFVEDDTMFCSCKHFERFGIPCQHMFHVLKTFRGYHEPTKYDVKIRWWTVYYQFGFLDNEQSNAISDLMEVISQKDISGPSCHGYTCDRPTRSNYKHTDFFFETNSPPIASNYQISDSMFKEALMMASSFGISFLFSSQDHFGYQSDSIDFETQYTCIDENEPITKHSKTTAYSYLSTSFRELCSSSEDLSVDR